MTILAARMQRRSFLCGLASLTAGFASSFTEAAERMRLAAFMIGLPLDHPIVLARLGLLKRLMVQRGWVEGQNIRYLVRSSNSDPQTLATTARDLVGETPDVIVAGSSTETAAVLAATRTIPVLFSTASDPLGSGFVRSLERPEGNATGFSNNEPSMAAKWVDLLREIAPATVRIGVIYNPVSAAAGGVTYVEHLRWSAKEVGMSLVSAPVATMSEIEPALAELAAQPGTGLFFPPDSFTFRNARAIAPLVAKYRMPTMYPYETFVEAGGLMSYTGGRDESDLVMASYIDLIFRGANVAELPVQFSRSFELVINEKAATALGLTIPLSLRVRASRIVS
ncbi:putative ABC transport system substrate-binding protein [Bosea sp. OK403]|uniref:ABC transporter substrate-binding protein n=1 Tax=Bosea sp. OK403 TaxID=1855286 RepID=UPI0008EF2F1C|nr:ABC transporter substrate-binding protein [Bosea sp. OK403]SFI98393.1 putative ABC transport system substrate-binding protein [Bosea sp. OK403]